MTVYTRWLDIEAEDPAIVILKAPGEHAHAAEEGVVAITAIVEQMLGLVAADPTQPVKRVYDNVVAQAARVEDIPPFDLTKTGRHGMTLQNWHKV